MKFKDFNYKVGNKTNRIKAICIICGEPIYNRMRYNSYRNKYAHTSCVKKKYGTLIEWEPAW